jgi:ribonuclease P protein component
MGAATRHALGVMRSPADFRRIQEQSASRSHPTVLVRVRRNETDRSRYGISTSRKLGTAVVRNKVRRRIRSILRTLAPRIAPGWDILIVCRPSAAAVSQHELAATLIRLLGAAKVLEDTEGNTDNT